MVLKKLLQLFGVGKKNKKDDKKKVHWIAGAAPHSTLNIFANNSQLDPSSSGAGTTLSLQKHDPECSSNISMIKEAHGSENDDYNSFNQFDVVQHYSDHHYAKTSPGKATKDWAKTIQNEWKLLQRDLPESIYVRVYEDRIDLLRAAIIGPAGTPYHDGLFFFDVHFPPGYPQCPPKVHYRSGGLRINPNLYESGKVCHSLLNTWLGSGSEKWGKSNSTMLQVLVSIQGLVLNDKPYFNEPALFSSKEKHSLAYNTTAFLLSCKTMLYSLQNPPKNFETIIVCHFHEREQAILEACGAYASGMIVGSLVKDGRTYVRNKCFARFKKSLDAQTELLKKELAANRFRALELKRHSTDEIVSTS
ncbi:putative ubiquitin-conjugating enzyme E2 38 isoform X2 [Lolium perenne]|uniref:putative ubiquitin-conjugating enzyme E2 38 isoform X2 n=1 Tax=Lolium perenne TaxID=4522 RepID=UPI0021F5F64C|nr:probable ubiquitin-conjugating enzyme E2 25 isoform X2 [Lolium perenne]